MSGDNNELSSLLTRYLMVSNVKAELLVWTHGFRVWPFWWRRHGSSNRLKPWGEKPKATCSHFCRLGNITREWFPQLVLFFILYSL